MNEEQTITLTATSDNLYGSEATAATDSVTFKITFESNCEDPTRTSLIDPGQTNPSDDAYTGTPVTFTYNPVTASSNNCPLTVTCDGPVTYTGLYAYTGGLTCAEIVNDEVQQTYTTA